MVALLIRPLSPIIKFAGKLEWEERPFWSLSFAVGVVATVIFLPLTGGLILFDIVT